MKRPLVVFGIALFVTSAFWIAVIAVHKHGAHRQARSVVESVIPAYAAKVEKTVAGLQGETPSESVSNLYYVTDYFNPGPAVDIYTDEYRYRIVLDEIMSNRRFRKTFSELRQMNQAAASQFVETNLISAIARYSGIYEHTMQILLQHYKTNSAVQPTKGFAFEVGFTKPGDEGRETLMGEKMKVFSLIWISGMLRLADSREEVEQVVRLALKQKKALDSDSTLQPMVKQSMLKSGILYNPEVLSSGLIGVTYREAGMESDVMKAAGIRWQQRTLAAYDAALTEFDKPVQSGVLVPDRSTGSLTVNFVSHMNDTNFDLLLREIHFK